MNETTIRPVAFVQRLSEAGRTALEQLLVRRRFGPGEMVIAHGDQSANVYFVLSGSARATVFADDGKMVAYRDMQPGDIFGELAAIDSQPRSASVVAIDALEVGTVTPEQFIGLTETAPDFTRALLSHLATQSRSMTERIFEFSTMIVRERLAHELLRLAGANGRDDGSAVITAAPTHFDLAARISTHREAVSREMSRLGKLNLIKRDGRRLILQDIAALRDIEGI